MKIALIQHAPVWYDLKASMEKADSLLKEATANGASWAFFGESWLSGYPAWLDHCPEAGIWNHPPVKALYARMVENSPFSHGPESESLAELSASLGIGIMMGVNERTNTGSLYNSLWTFTPENGFVNNHRKLVPTYTEKLVHTPGDANGLIATSHKGLTIGGMICWEHWMPHTRQAMHEQAEDLHIAVWPWVHDMHQVATRSYAFEGRCFAASVGQILAVKDLPIELAPLEELQDDPERLLLRGGSCVAGPDGQFILDPHLDEETILYCELDLSILPGERMNLDVSRNYARDDVFTFGIDRERRRE